MRTFSRSIRLFVLIVLIMAGFVASVPAQEVSIPDPGLNAAIRAALQKPDGPLTEQDMLSLTVLNVVGREVRSIDGLGVASNLTLLTIQFNQITNFMLPAGLTKMNTLDISFNPLTNCSLPSGLTNLTTLIMEADGLTNLTLPEGLTHLIRLELSENHLTSIDLPAGLTNLTILDLAENHLTNLTLPPDMKNLKALFLNGNPLATLVLSEPLAATNMADTVMALRNQGVSVFTYPLEVNLSSAHRTGTGAFEFTITGPPRVYEVLSSPDLVEWNATGAVTNEIGSVVFTDGNIVGQKFYLTH